MKLGQESNDLTIRQSHSYDSESEVSFPALKTFIQNPRAFRHTIFIRIPNSLSLKLTKLLKNFYTTTSIIKPPKSFVWWRRVLQNLCMGLAKF